MCVCLPSGSDSMMYGVAAACYHREQVALYRDKLTTHWPDLMRGREKQTKQLPFYSCGENGSCLQLVEGKKTEAGTS